jgi:hypothetical protein
VVRIVSSLQHKCSQKKRNSDICQVIEAYFHKSNVNESRGNNVEPEQATGFAGQRD